MRIEFTLRLVLVFCSFTLGYLPLISHARTPVSASPSTPGFYARSFGFQVYNVSIEHDRVYSVSPSQLIAHNNSLIDSTEDIAELLERARHGESAAIEEMMKRYKVSVDRWVRRAFVRNGSGEVQNSDVENVAQEVFGLALTEEWLKKAEQVSWFSVRLKQLVIWQTIAYLKRYGSRTAKGQQRAVLFSEQEDDPGSQLMNIADPNGRTPEQIVVQRYEAEHALALLEQLPPQERDAVTEVVLRGTSAVDAAKQLRIPRGELKGLVEQGLRKMREALDVQSAQGQAQDSIPISFDQLLEKVKRREVQLKPSQKKTLAALVRNPLINRDALARQLGINRSKLEEQVKELEELTAAME